MTCDNFEDWMEELNRIATEDYDQFSRDPENPVWRKKMEINQRKHLTEV